MEAKLSVIVPVYNTEKYLPQCLDSLLAQTYRNIEIICVDDCSPDKSAKILEEYAQKNSNIKIVHHKKNRGLFAARVTGLKAMTGDYFAFCDSDDTVTLDFYRAMMSRAQKNSCDIVASDFVEVRNDGTYYPNRQLQQCDFVLNDEEVLDKLMHGEDMDYTWHLVWNKIYSKSLLKETLDFLCEKAEQYNFVLAEDICFSTIFFSQSKRFENIHGEFYFYNRRESTSTAHTEDVAKVKKSIKDTICAFQIVFEFYKLNGLFSKYENNLRNWKGKEAYMWAMKTKDLSCSKKEKLSIDSLIDELGEKDLGESRKELRSFYSSHYVFMKLFPLQEIKNAIADEKCKCVSFDIFDTLIVRPFLVPTDLFIYMEPEVTKITGSLTNFEFCRIRVRAEKLARDEKWQKQRTGEVTLDEIYIQLQKMCPILEPFLERIKKLELETELRFVQPRKYVVELVEFAHYLGKKIICTSDMYLPETFERQLLAKCGITRVDKIFVSSDYGISKFDGKIFSFIENELNLENCNFIHIGDNYSSDVEKARKAGWKAYFIPKTTDCMYDCVPNWHYGRAIHRTYRDKNYYDLCRNNSPEERFLGTRCMLALQAHKLFDNPFIQVQRGSDFNADPSRLGYFALGPFLLAYATKIAELASAKKYDQINFVARDGYLPMEAFKIVAATKKLSIKTNYVYTSRKAVAIMWLADKCTLYSFLLPNYNPAYTSPSAYINLFSPVIKKEKIVGAKEIFENAGLKFDEPLKSIENQCKFSNIFIENFYDEPLIQKFLEQLKNCYRKDFDGHTLLVDVGYSCRFESSAKRLFGFDIDACYVHMENNQGFLRCKENDIKIYTLYDYQPIVTGAIREIMISKLAPSCIGFEFDNNELKPVFEDLKHNPVSDYVIESLQKSALEFVRDFCGIFGSDFDKLPWRKQEACLPLEFFLHHGQWHDRNIFSVFPFEDDIGGFSMMGTWNNCYALANTRNSNTQKKLDINQKKILCVTQELTYTGSPRSLLRICKVIKALGYKPVVWSMRDGLFIKEYKENNIEVRIVPEAELNKIETVKSLKDFEMAICNTIMTDKYVRLFEHYLPVVWYIREATNVMSFCTNNLERLYTFKHSKNLCCVSKYAQKAIKKNTKHKVKVVHNSVEDEINMSTDYVSGSGDKVKFVQFGTIELRKGYDIFISAYKSMPKDYQEKSELYFAGNGLASQKEFVDNILTEAENNDSINYLGLIDSERKKIETLSNMDVVVVASRDESCSLVALEGAMLSKPLIVTKNVGAKYMVGEKNGFVVETGDVESLKTAMMKIIDKKQSLAQMGKVSREYYDKFASMESHTDALEKLIKKKIREKRKFKKIWGADIKVFPNTENNKIFIAMHKLPQKAKKGIAFYKKNGLKATVRKTLSVVKRFVKR